MSIQLKGSDDSVYSNDIIAPNIPTIPGGQFAGYQQGVWTPTIKSEDGVRTAVNYGTQVGNFTRIGNSVTAYFDLTLADITGIVQSDTLAIGDFPYFSFNGAAGSYASSATIHANGLSDSEVIFLNILLSSNKDRTNPIYFHSKAGPGATYYQLRWAQLGTGSLISQITYLTDDTTWTPINGATVS